MSNKSTKSTPDSGQNISSETALNAIKAQSDHQAMVQAYYKQQTQIREKLKGFKNV